MSTFEKAVILIGVSSVIQCFCTVIIMIYIIAQTELMQQADDDDGPGDGPVDRSKPPYDPADYWKKL